MIFVDADFNPSITPYPDGPYYVNDVTRFANQRGPIRTRPTMVLCRCGASANKPFCDGAHVKIGFSSGKSERPVENQRDNDAGGGRAPESSVAIFVAPNGPYVVTGGPELRNTPRQEGASTQRFALCRCGGSNTKPFCDGSHQKNGFKDEQN